jgi:hypothetical protein
MEFLAGQLRITKDEAMAQIAQSNFLKMPATVRDTANAAVMIAFDRARLLTGTVVNATAGAALRLSAKENCPGLLALIVSRVEVKHLKRK